MKSGVQTKQILNIVFIELLFLTAKKWKQHKGLSTDKWINKLWYTIHTMEYYLAITRNEIWTQAPTCLKLENIMLNERNQTQKATHYMISYI